MHFKFRHLEKIVGGFFILTCIIVVVLMVIVARGQRWFQKFEPYACYFSYGGSLHVGSLVMIQGLEAGKVTRVDLDPDNRVRVHLNVFRQYADRIREDSTARLSTPMIGSSSVEILPGTKDSPLIPARGVIPSKEAAESSLDELIESANNLLNNLNKPDGDFMQALANINRATKDLSTSLASKDGSLRKFIERRDFYDELLKATTHLENILAGIDEKTPDIMDAVTEARRGLEEANKAIRALQKSVFLRGNIEKYLKEDSTLRAEGR